MGDRENRACKQASYEFLEKFGLLRFLPTKIRTNEILPWFKAVSPHKVLIEMT